MNLNPYWMFWKFFLIIGVAGQLFPSAAAAAASALTCDITQQADGLFMYRLSRPPSSSSCKDRETCWEDQDKKVFARDLDYNPDVVQNLTNQFIILKDCWDYLHYTKNCFRRDFEEAHCRVNCTLLLEKDLHPIPVNLTCLFGSWCPSPTVIGLGITSILLLAVGVLVVLYVIFKRRLRRSAAQTASYSPVTEEIKMKSGDVQRVDII